MFNDHSARSDANETTTASRHETRKPRQEHSVPWFWPFAAAIEFGEEGMRLFEDNLEFLSEAQLMSAPPAPERRAPLAAASRSEFRRVAHSTFISSVGRRSEPCGT